MTSGPATPFAGGRHGGRVAAARTLDYSPAAVAAGVAHALEPFGGAGAILDGRTRVLLKPNVLRPAAPDDAVTTHPEVVRAVARAFMEAGAEVSVGDSPGGDPGPARPAFEVSGIAGVCTELGLSLRNFQETESVPVDLPYSPAGSIRIAAPVAEAELVVNLPKFKTHTLTHLTCALKNPYGFIPGFLKGRLHTCAPRVAEFVQIVCALWAVYPPEFTLIDAVVGMEGQGPSGGDPRHVGWILAGTDPVALDAVCAHTMGFDPRRIPLIAEAVRRQLGTGTLGAITVENAQLADLALTGFVRPRTSLVARFTPRWLLGALTNLAPRLFWVRPSVNPKPCIRCHRCVRSCPTEAMQGVQGEAPHLAAPDRCISCLCCQEICPARAISTRRSFFVSRIFRSAARRDAQRQARKPTTPPTDN